MAQVDSIQEIRDSYTELKNSEKQIAENRKNLTMQESQRDVNAKLLAEAGQTVAACEAEQQQHLSMIAAIEPQLRQARALDIRIEGAKANQKEAKAEHEQSMQSKSKIEKSIAAIETSIKKAEQKSIKIGSNGQKLGSIFQPKSTTKRPITYLYIIYAKRTWALLGSNP